MSEKPPRKPSFEVRAPSENSNEQTEPKDAKYSIPPDYHFTIKKPTEAEPTKADAAEAPEVPGQEGVKTSDPYLTIAIKSALGKMPDNSKEAAGVMGARNPVMIRLDERLKEMKARMAEAATNKENAPKQPETSKINSVSYKLENIKSSESKEGKEGEKTPEGGAEKGPESKEDSAAEKGDKKDESGEKTEEGKKKRSWEGKDPKDLNTREKISKFIFGGQKLAGKAAVGALAVGGVAALAWGIGATWGAPVVGAAGLGAVGLTMLSGLSYIGSFAVIDGLVMKAAIEFFFKGGIKDWANETFGFLGVKLGKGGGDHKPKQAAAHSGGGGGSDHGAGHH